MTVHLRNTKCVSTLLASLFAVCFFAIWPVSADAKNNNSTHVQHQELTIKKTSDTASPSLKKLPGKKKPPTLTLKRGKSAD
jgi:hypothetical protein